MTKGKKEQDQTCLIRISKDTKNKLISLGKMKDTYEDVIKRLLEKKSTINK